MDARSLVVTTLIVAAPLVAGPVSASAATIETDNFTVTAPSEAFARQVGEAAEYFREQLAIEWLGQPLPGNWSSKCPIKCKVGQIGAGGATTFTFNNGEVFGWHMSIQGTEQRILDSVLPHEVSHMIFASYFRRPLPRWADEGAATLVEHESERLRQTRLLDQVIRTSKRIPLRQLLNIKEYPQDMQDVLTLYAEGYSLADYLVQQKGENGKAIYLRFLNDAHHQGWEAAFEKYYDTDVASVEENWTGWVMAGSPPLSPVEGTLVAEVDQPGAPAASGAEGPTRVRELQATDETVVRGQSTSELAPLPSLERARSSAAWDGSLAAPRPPAALASQDAVFDQQFETGEHRMTAQPPQPAVVELIAPADPTDTTSVDIPRRRRETLAQLSAVQASSAESRTATDALARDDSSGQPRPVSFDAVSGSTGDRMSSAPITAENPQEAGAPTGLGPDSADRFPRPAATNQGRTPSYRGFTTGRGGPSTSARGLFSP